MTGSRFRFVVVLAALLLSTAGCGAGQTAGPESTDEFPAKPESFPMTAHYAKAPTK